MKISKSKTMIVFLMSITPHKNCFPRSKSMLGSPCARTDTHTETLESEYRVHPVRDSGMFPSTYHQGSVQYQYILCILTAATLPYTGCNDTFVHPPQPPVILIF